MIKDYFLITKPGIIFGNAITVVAGFFLASKGNINYLLLCATLVGLSFVVASGCVFNNTIDRDIDMLMERTKNRAIANGRIPLRVAISYATILGAVGLTILLLATNLLTSLAALFGLLIYVAVYSMWLKRKSTYGTIVGSISGAIPPVVGYLAVSNTIDSGAIILFLILVAWQMTHSFAIAIYRIDDYKAAAIPVLPVEKGFFLTKIHMTIYVILFIIATSLLFVFGFAGQLFFVLMILFGLLWLGSCLRGFGKIDNMIWARNVFIFSIIIIVLFCVLIVLDPIVFNL